MRRATREMDAAFALEVFDKAPFVTVSMVRPDGTPYGLPLSLVRTDEIPLGSVAMHPHRRTERRQFHAAV